MENSRGQRHTVDDSLRVGFHYLVDKLITKGLTDIGCSPEKTDRRGAFKDGRCAWPDTGSGGNKDDAVEHLGNAHHTIGGNPTLPDMSRRFGDDVDSPVTGSADNEGEAFLSGFRDRRKTVPFH